MASNGQASIVVHQLKPEQNYVVLKTSGNDSLTQGTVLDAPQGGQPCKLKIYYAKGGLAGATYKECPAAKDFHVGQEISIAPSEERPEPPASEEPVSKDRDSEKRPEHAEEAPRDSGEAKYHHVGVQAYYSTATTVEEKYSTSGQLVSNVSNSYLSSGAPGLGARYTYIKRYSKPTKELHFGGMAAFNYEFSRTLNQVKTEDGSVSDLTGYSFKLSYFEANAVAEYNGIYGLIGPNLSFISINSPDQENDLVNRTGTLGMQIGAGYSFGTFGVEALYRTINAKLTSAVVDVDVASPQSRLWGFVLRVRADFSL